MIKVIVEKIVTVLRNIEFGKRLTLRRIDMGFKLGFREGVIALDVESSYQRLRTFVH